MKTFSNARARRASDWKGLFEVADGRFVVERVERPVGSNLFMIVAVWKP